MKQILILLVVVMILVLPVLAQEPEAKKKPGFSWEWEGNKQTPPKEAPRPPSEKPAPGREDKIKKLYQELVKTNMALESQLEIVFSEKEDAEREKTRLSIEIKKISTRSEALTKRVDELQKSVASTSGDSVKLAQLGRELKLVRREKQALASELSKLRILKAGTGGNSDGAVQSDYVIKLRKEKANLIQKMSLLRSEYVKELRVRKNLDSKEQQRTKKYNDTLAKNKKLEKLLMSAATNLKQQQETREKLTSAADSSESRAAKLKLAMESKDDRLDLLEKDLRAKKRDLEKAEGKIVQLKLKQDDGPPDVDQRRDYHYNLAVLYTEKGMLREAEKEYLRAMKADRSDADVHFNLAVLYDDSLDNRKKAAKHYRRYLEMRPQAKDADKVRNWLLDIEITEGLN